MRAISSRCKITVLSLLFVTVVFFIGTSGVEATSKTLNPSSIAPLAENQRDIKSDGIAKKVSGKMVQRLSHRHKKESRMIQVHNSSKYATTEEMLPSSEPSSTQSTLESNVKKNTKLSGLKNTKVIPLLALSNSSSDVAKRNSLISIFDIGSSKTPENSIEIDIKAYTPPPNAPAVIEIMQTPSHKNSEPYLNNHIQNSWSGYKYYPLPQEINLQKGWNTIQNQNPFQPRFSYVPTEELLHKQSYSRNFQFSPHYLYQYPVTHINTNNVKSKKEDNSEKVPKLLNNPVTTSKEDQKSPYSENSIKGIIYSKVPSLSQYTKTQHNPVVQLPQQFPFQYLQSIPMNPTIHIQLPQPMTQHVVSHIPINLNPGTNEIKETVFVKADPQITDYKPGLKKYVTSSYYLRTYPKLEWVPL